MPAEWHALRVRPVNDALVRRDGDFVLYWMSAARRVNFNFGLERAVEWARELQRPLVVLETLPCGDRWDNDRLHRFALDGMRDNRDALATSGALYHPFVETSPGQERKLLAALGEHVCIVVADDFPTPRPVGRITSALAEVRVRAEVVDSNGLLPMRAADRVYPTAFAFRRFLQHELPKYLGQAPKANPLARVELRPIRKLPADLARRWQAAPADLLDGAPNGLRELPIDHSVPAAATRGGPAAGVATLRRFVRDGLSRYGELRNEPEQDVASGLSPYLHFGHLSVHQVLDAIARATGWSIERIGQPVGGRKTGWWGAAATVESFLDELVTWRELGYNFCWQRDDFDQYESLPAWARQTLEKHAGDRRPHAYTPEELERGETHDALWNAAQMQLVREGRIHNYLRMLWGKKILEWSPTPRAALDLLIHLNNKYALDGRNPNSYSGIFWCLGRYDRPWFPERPIFGTIRYMSSENTARKVRVREYIARYGPRPQAGLFA